MKRVITKKVTINDLSETIDNLAIMVAKGFDEVNKKIDKEIGDVKRDIFDVKRDIIEVKENLASTRRDVLAMGDRFTLKHELYDLANRVVLLEQKGKVKG